MPAVYNNDNNIMPIYSTAVGGGSSSGSYSTPFSQGTPPSTSSGSPSGDGSPSGGGPGGGSGSGSGSGFNTDLAASNLKGVAGWNQQTAMGFSNNGDKVYDISDQQNKLLRDLQAVQYRRNASNDWFTQQQRLQTVSEQLREAQGNSLRGSNLYDMWDLLARKDDMDDAEVLNSLRENLNGIDNDYWRALMATNNSRNQMYADTEKSLRDITSDYVSQLNSLKPEEAAQYVAGTTLSPPGWLRNEWFSSHVRGPIQPEDRPLVRGEHFVENRWGAGRPANTGQPNYHGASAKDYWSRMFGGYERRV